MSIEKVKQYLDKLGLKENIIEFETSSATVELAAQAVGCGGEQIAKTMSFDRNGKTILIVLAGDTRVDNAKFKATFGGKAKMLSIEEVESRVGHKVGGVCPFAVNEGVDIYLDVSLKRFDYVYPAAGNDYSAVKLDISQLELASCSVGWVDVGKF